MTQHDDELSFLEEDTEPPVEDGQARDAPAVVIMREGDQRGQGWPQAPDALDPELVRPTDAPDEVEQARLLSDDLMFAIFELEESLRAMPDVTEVICAHDPPVPDFTLETVEISLGRALPPDVRALYKVIDGLHVRWCYRDADSGEERLGGELRIPDFATVFGRWFDTLWVHDDALDEAHLDLMWQLRGFDLGVALPEAMTVLHLRGDWGSDYALMLHVRESHQLVPLRLDLMDYLYAAIAARGTPLWQLPWSGYDFDADPWRIAGAARFFEQMTRRFSEVDLTPWREAMAQG